MRTPSLSALRRARHVVLACVLLAVGFGSSALAQRPLQAFPQTNQLIVHYRDAAQSPFGLSHAEFVRRAHEQAERLGLQLTHVRALDRRAQVLRLPEMMGMDKLQELTARLRVNPLVASVEPDYIMQIQHTPNDPRYAEQWHYYESAGGLNLPAAWDLAQGQGAVIAVIDTGVRPHADLAGRVLSGYDFISDASMANDGDGRDGDATDPGDWLSAGECGWYSPPSDQSSSWHGTHVAGTIAAATDNSLGVAGVAGRASVLPVRVLGKCGGYTSDIVDAIRWSAGLSVDGVPANPTPAQVINMSLGGKASCGQSYRDAISAARAAGTTVVVAAGNSSADASGYTPASCPGVIAVAATDRRGGLASYSNYGSVVAVAAPGGEQSGGAVGDGVLSTLNAGGREPGADSYGFYQGTSMASPHVAGVVALMISVRPNLTPDLVEKALTGSTRSFPATGSDACDTSRCGSGIVDAAAAVLAAQTVEEEEEPSFVCTEHSSSTRAHLDGGRADRCWGWYACAKGSGTYLGFVSSYGSVTLAETAPGYYDKGSCN